MADEVKVLNSSVLRQYAARLDSFSSSVQSSCRKSIDELNIECHKVHNKKNELDGKERDANRKVQDLVDYYEQVINQYNLYGENVMRLGTSNVQAQMKLTEFMQLIESLKSNLNSILLRSESLKERMKDFSTHIEQVSHQGIESLKQQASVIEKYKATQR